MDVHTYWPVDIQQVLNKLLECDPTACFQGCPGWICPVLGNDGFPKQGVVVIVGIFELIPVCRHHSLQRLSDKHDFGVGLQTVHDSLTVKAVKGLKMVAIVDCVMFNALSIGGLACQHHQGPFPVGTACLGHLTVQQLVLVLHKQVFYMMTSNGPGDAAFVLSANLLH